MGKLGIKITLPVPRLYESVPITIGCFLEFLEQIWAFDSADSDTDATVTCSGV